MIWIFLFIPFLLSAYTADVTLSSTNINLEEMLVVTLKLTYPENDVPPTSLLHHQLLSANGASPPVFRLQDEHFETTPTNMTATFTLEPILPGSHPLSFFEIPFKKTTLYTDVYNVEVEPYSEPLNPLDFTAALLPVAPTLPYILSPENRALSKLSRNTEILEEHSFPLKQIALFFLLFFGLYGALAYVRSQSKPALLLTPEEQLTTIEKQTLTPQTYTRLVDTVREYIHQTYHVNAPQMTSEEFLKEMMQHQDLKNEKGSQLSAFLFYADKVKFTGMNPSKTDFNQAIQAAKDLIK